MDRVCAVIVTHFPARAIVENVNLLSDQADEVVVVDNGTTGSNAEYLEQLQDISRVTLIRNGQNLGIAVALNIGARYAIEHGYPWLATFDQDSTVPVAYFKEMFAGRDSIQSAARVAIFAPIFYDQSTRHIWSMDKCDYLTRNCGELDVAITSGSVIATQLFAEVGFFDESLFIDYVDFDFCLRCRQKGYKIIQISRAVLNHNLGRMAIHNVLGRSISVSNHGVIRRYYITRNRLALYSRYVKYFPKWVLKDVTGLLKESAKILAFEENKFAKFGMMYLGVWHALIAKRGPLREYEPQNSSGQLTYGRNKQINLPNFFVVGAAKSGTSSICSYLRRHPEIFIAPIKEPHFFSSDISIACFRLDYRNRVCFDIQAYLRNHPLPQKHIAHVEDRAQYLELFREARDEKAIGELSTGYLYSSCAAGNLFDFNPAAKIVMVLRQPVERAYSHYVMNLRDLWDSDSGFINALERDFAASEKGWGKSHLYVELGLYFEQVGRYLKRFPEKQVRIFLYEDIKSDPAAFFKELCAFLGVTPAVLNERDMAGRHNVAALPRFKISGKYYPALNVLRKYLGMAMPDRLKAHIRNAMFSRNNVPALREDEFAQAMKYFGEDIQKLSVLIKRDLQSWHQMSK